MKSLQTSQLNDGRIVCDDRMTVERWATPQELHELAEKIRARRALEPKWRYLRCDNPRCRRPVRLPSDSPVVAGCPCVICNILGNNKKGFLGEMSRAEGQAWEREVEAAVKAAGERATKAAWTASNRSREEAGLDPIPFEEYSKKARADFEATCRRDASVAGQGQK